MCVREENENFELIKQFARKDSVLWRTEYRVQEAEELQNY